MICTFLFHSGDVERLIDLLKWIEQLGGCKAHDALLVADTATPYTRCAVARRMALRSFREVRCISNAQTITGWPQGPNSLYWSAAKYIYGAWHQPWLVMETDAVPLKRGWLDLIESAYREHGSLFMGDIYQGLNSSTGLPVTAMSGIAVYPFDAVNLMTEGGKLAWDMDNREVMLKNGMATQLIQHFYGTKKIEPTFVKVKQSNSPKNAFDLSNIRNAAVIFHRNKDGTLINLLREKLGIVEKKPLMIVFPVCNKDAHLLESNFKWMLELDGPSKRNAILAHDGSLNAAKLQSLRFYGKQAFPLFTEYVYPIPKTMSWPQAPNHSFQYTARNMAKYGAPWLWMEADAWPLKRGWLDILDEAYQNCGKLVMGPKVPGMGHVNGVAIYPHNFCDLSVKAMSCVNIAWDAACKADIQGIFHDAADLMHHIWGMSADGKFTDYNGNGSPTFKTESMLNLIKPTAVLLHRVKDLTLVTWLRKRKNESRNINSNLRQGHTIPSPQPA